MEEDKIKKLLGSSNAEDMLVGWELLKTKKYSKTDTRWYDYFNILSLHASGDTRELACEFIIEVAGSDWNTNPFWLKWSDYNYK